ncbi:MAG: alpha/beta hydrolase [Acidimicrobiales bacterium]|nr:alpha/beta hydrolase [Acidimicrobiales bacterium]
MESFEAGGIAVAYDEQGDGPAVLFLHNGGTSSTIWRRQVAALSDRYRTIAVDLPGFGAAPHRGRATLAAQVTVLSELLDELGVTDVVAVGNCMGSNMACGLADARPDVVRGLVLCNPLTEATFSAGWLGPLHRMARVAPRPTAALRGLSRRVVVPKPLAPAVLRFQLGARGVAANLHHDPALVATCCRRAQLPALIDVLDDLSAYGELDRRPDPVAVPTVVVWGEANRVLSPDVGAALDARLAPETSVVLAGCGHLPMLEDAEAVTHLIEELLGGRLEAVAVAREAS